MRQSHVPSAPVGSSRRLIALALVGLLLACLAISIHSTSSKRTAPPTHASYSAQAAPMGPLNPWHGFR